MRVNGQTRDGSQMWFVDCLLLKGHATGSGGFAAASRDCRERLLAMGDEESGSMLGGAEEFLGSAWDAAKNVVEAGVDTAINVAEAGALGVVRIAAGGAYAVGATDTAASLDDTSYGMVDDMLHREYEAQSDIKQAWGDVWGNSDESSESGPEPINLVPEE